MPLGLQAVISVIQNSRFAGYRVGLGAVNQ